MFFPVFAAGHVAGKMTWWCSEPFRRGRISAWGQTVSWCPNATVVDKKPEWRLWVHRKAPWAVRAWYYGPKRPLRLRSGKVVDTLPPDLAVLMSEPTTRVSGQAVSASDLAV